MVPTHVGVNRDSGLCELIHLIEPNHTPEFWLRLERALPDYEQRKDWLAQHGGKYVVL